MSYTLSSTDQSSPVEDLASSGKVFALLRPANAAARKAYDATLKVAADYPTRFGYANKFVQSEPEPVGAESGSGIEEDEDVLEFGSFKFSLDILPSTRHGWYLGICQGVEDGWHFESSCLLADILLGPPTVESQSLGLETRHARIFPDSESGRAALEARCSVTVGGDVPQTIRDSALRVLEHKEQIRIGDCLYVFEHTDFFHQPTFRENLSVFLNWQGAYQLPPSLPMFDAQTSASGHWQEHEERVAAQQYLLWGWEGVTAGLGSFRCP